MTVPSFNRFGSSSTGALDISRSIRAGIFDMDGVLLDSEPLHYRATNDLLAREGCGPLTFEDFIEYLGVTDRDMWSDLICRYDLRNPPASYLARYDAIILDSYRLSSQIAPGVLTLLAHLRLNHLPLAVASSSRQTWVETCLDALGIRSQFQALVTADQVQRGKPDPEIYLLAARALGMAPGDCFAIEDSPKGIAAARAAGMYTIAVETPYTPTWMTAEAHMQIPSLAACPELWPPTSWPTGEGEEPRDLQPRHRR